MNTENNIANNLQEKKHLIIDTSYLLFRSYFAYPNLKTQGRATGAIFGFLRTLINLIKFIQPDSVYFALDLPKKTWRHDLFDDYKAGRPPLEENMKTQIPVVVEMIKKLTSNICAVEGFEADDVIFSLSKKLSGQVYVFSSDKDLYQLFINENVKFVRVDKGFVTFYNVEDFSKQYGVPANLWVDFKALVGDKSDNLQGVAGIGPKTATYILQKTGGLVNLFKALKLDPSLLQNRKNNMEKTGECIEFLNSEKGQKIVQKILQDSNNLVQTFQLAQLQNIEEKIEINQQNPDFNKIVSDLENWGLQTIISELKNASLVEKITDQNTLF